MVEIDSKKSTESFVVVDGLPAHVILGKNWCEQNKLKINYNKKAKKLSFCANKFRRKFSFINFLLIYIYNFFKTFFNYKIGSPMPVYMSKNCELDSVKGTIDGCEIDCTIDTSASVSIISFETAKKLNLEILKSKMTLKTG